MVVYPKKNPIWYFDSSGNFITDKNNQSMSLLYSFIMYDPENKLIIPISEFVTTSHTILNISKYLLSIKSIINANTKKDDIQLSKLVVTDFSWALINSVLNIFNNCNTNQYLALCFDYLVLNPQSHNLLSVFPV